MPHTSKQNFREGTTGRGLTYGASVPSTQMNVESCTAACQAAGYILAGIEGGDECCKLIIISQEKNLTANLTGCGDVADIAANGGTNAPQTDCSFACSGDPAHLCGGAERLSYYAWQGNLNVWHTPANKGSYQVIINGCNLNPMLTPCRTCVVLDRRCCCSSHSYSRCKQ